jgi:integrase
VLSSVTDRELNNSMVNSFGKKTKGGMPMYMKLVDGRWYANIRNPKNWKKIITNSLDAYEHETRKATTNLGKLMADLERGVNPTSARKNIGKLFLEGRITERTKGILETHIYPFFGGYKPREVDRRLIEKYIEHRYGLSPQGGLQAYNNTIVKELTALQRLMQTVFGDNYKLPKVKYEKLSKDILPALTLGQIEHASKFINDSYLPVFWTMAYTGADISDVLDFAPKHFKDGWIIKERGKTEEQIYIPVCEPLAAILKTVPWPINQESKIFPGLKPKATSTYMRRAFRLAGLPGYGSKYLRRFVASIMLDNGYSNDWIGKALAHSEGSKVTRKYTKVYKDTMKEAFGKIKGTC